MDDLTERSGEKPEATCDSLEGAALDAAVAQAEGRKWRVDDILYDYRQKVATCLVARAGWDKRIGDYELYRPSLNWDEGGPIIQREQITLNPPTWRHPDDWVAAIWTHGLESPERLRYIVGSGSGRTPLIAAMRAYVAARTQRSTNKTSGPNEQAPEA